MPRIVHIASKVDDLEEATNFTRMSSAFAKLAQDMPVRIFCGRRGTIAGPACGACGHSRTLFA
jgi:hypothetical protein